MGGRASRQGTQRSAVRIDHSIRCRNMEYSLLVLNDRGRSRRPESPILLQASEGRQLTNMLIQQALNRQNVVVRIRLSQTDRTLYGTHRIGFFSTFGRNCNS